MLLGILDTFEKLGDGFKNFLIDADRNPVVWIGLFLLGLVIFFLTYNALHKDYENQMILFSFDCKLIF